VRPPSCAPAASSPIRPIRATRSAATSGTRRRSSACAASARRTVIITSHWCAATSPTSGRFAKLDTWQFRLIKACTPGPYTFLLPATTETPRRLQHERRRTIGVRIPDHPVPLLLLAELGEPLMSSTLMLPGDALPLTDGREIRARLEHEIDAVLDGGNCGVEPTTVIDLAVSPPVVVRVGKGPVRQFPARNAPEAPGL
jgi:tRNA threonylcarbamoyl adenosine modification protein (Sua5/YciO/YrdC/YwlC family)